MPPSFFPFQLSARSSERRRLPQAARGSWLPGREVQRCLVNERERGAIPAWSNFENTRPSLLSSPPLPPIPSNPSSRVADARREEITRLARVIRPGVKAGLDTLIGHLVFRRWPKPEKDSFAKGLVQSRIAGSSTGIRDNPCACRRSCTRDSSPSDTLHAVGSPLRRCA